MTKQASEDVVRAFAEMWGNAKQPLGHAISVSPGVDQTDVLMRCGDRLLQEIGSLAEWTGVVEMPNGVWRFCEGDPHAFDDV